MFQQMRDTGDRTADFLYNNLRTIAANLKNAKISLNYVLQSNIEGALRNGCQNSKISSRDRIKAFVGIFALIYKNFERESWTLKTIFKGYREGPKTNGTYEDAYEVNEYCEKIEPKILKIVGRT